MKLLETIQKIIDLVKQVLGFFKIGQTSPVSTTQPIDIDLPTLANVKKLFIDNAKRVGDLHDYHIDLKGTKYIVRSESWSSARAEGISFETMLSRIMPKTFWYLYVLATQNNLVEIDVTSLYRPNASIHTIGIAVDIGYVKTQDGAIILYNNESRTIPEPKAETKLRKWAWNSGLINQYIGPWYHRGVLGLGQGWIKNQLRKNVGIEWDHRHHLHITVKTGR